MLGVSTGVLVLLLLMGGGDSVEVKEGEDVDIPCDLQSEMTVWWFRLKDNEVMEFIAGSTLAKIKGHLDTSKFSADKLSQKKLTLKNFKKHGDSGSYSCMIIKSNKLHFGPVTKLQGPPDPEPEIKVIPTTSEPRQTLTTARPCKSNTPKQKSMADIVGCELIILLPLAAGSGLLLILLILTILYCNSIRTRRCPHHYKRHPRNKPAGHRPLPNQPEF